jgi:alpha-galactosidase
MNKAKNYIPFFLIILAVAFSAARTEATSVASLTPPNAPAQIDIAGGRIAVRYAGRAIFQGTVDNGDEAFQGRVNVYKNGDRIEQVLLLTSSAPRRRMKLAGTVSGSGEAFPCEIERPARGPLLVRHASGLSRSLRNRAVYDRGADWALSVDFGPRAVVRPAGTATNGARTFDLECEGNEIVLRFRPRYYQKHRGLAFFEPWTYQVWPKSVAGWISWFAYFDRVTEKDILETADVFSEAMGPYGYDILQIDDGYQSGKGGPQLWLNPNAKFPGGLASLAGYIKSKGLVPGLWTGASFSDGDEPVTHPGWFVRDADGRPARGNWIDYIVDASNPAALAALITPLYKGLRARGWEYFKVDALRHLRYEGYNAHREYFDKNKIDLVAAYRRYAQTIREAIGRDAFMLGCWGIRPELAGIIDGCRIGDDGFAYAGLSQYNSFNNVVWRNDPDHIELNDDRYRSTLVTTLTGSILLLTDKPEMYRTGDLEPARRTAPVLFTLPGQIYDVDPSRSEALDRVDAEVSGSGPRPFDAGYTPACRLYLLEIERPFGSWAVLGRTDGDPAETISFADLGLDPEAEYLVFEFWTKKLVGSFTGGFAPGAIAPRFRSQAFCIRKREARPQVLATSRHVTCGGVDLADLRWEDGRLVGKSRLVAGDPYVIYLTQPAGAAFAGLDCRGAAVRRIEKDGFLVRVTLLAGKGGEVEWTAKYK